MGSICEKFMPMNIWSPQMPHFSTNGRDFYSQDSRGSRLINLKTPANHSLYGTDPFPYHHMALRHSQNQITLLNITNGFCHAQSQFSVPNIGIPLLPPLYYILFYAWMDHVRPQVGPTRPSA